MKTFQAWLAEFHPEIIDEGVLQDIASSRLARGLVAGAALTAGAAGLGSRIMAGNAAKSPANASQEDHDDDFVDDMSSDEGIAAEKAKMLRMAKQIPMKTTRQRAGGKEVDTSRGSAHFSGNRIDRAVNQAPRKFDPLKVRLPALRGGHSESPDFGGSAD